MDAQRLRDFLATKPEQCHVLVVGDIMLDKYYYGDVTRISGEAPVPITRVNSSSEKLGGSANIAYSLAVLGCRVSIAGFVGR
ncbi:MAG: D-glycero-beta-D-manno-heptose-7-phosphate kinase, partial [Selenomonas sp.]|nr:D-glycero-beta-D-manno-heptose-7-phosphate kinase [Selenomonas sp.]